VSYGPRPWQQTHWDWRAAGNFICGGAGSGFVVFATLAGASNLAVFAGLALVGLGLLCVWLEIGRPLRAFNVFLHPRRSWMSREAIAAVLLFVTGGLALFADPSWRWAAGVLALAFAYCQARMIAAARAIPAWREPRVVPLLLVTALAEGGGLWVLAVSPSGTHPQGLFAFAALLLVRSGAWVAYRRRVKAAEAARSALDGAGKVLHVIGLLLPLSLLAALPTGAGTEGATFLAAAAGLAGVAAGAYFKLVLITRAGYNQGFALAHLPVRGGRSRAQPGA
jgi:phenylacetyl-CoA:acceptor oxidoreductase subunit 2